MTVLIFIASMNKTHAQTVCWPSPAINFANKTASDVIAYFGGSATITSTTSIILTGTLLIDVPINFVNCPNIICGEGFIFQTAGTLPTGYTSLSLFIDNCTIQGCDYMWGGAYMANSFDQLIVKNSTIKHMEGGFQIYSGFWQVHNNTFTDNKQVFVNIGNIQSGIVGQSNKFHHNICIWDAATAKPKYNVGSTPTYYTTGWTCFRGSGSTVFNFEDCTFKNYQGSINVVAIANSPNAILVKRCNFYPAYGSATVPYPFNTYSAVNNTSTSSNIWGGVPVAIASYNGPSSVPRTVEVSDCKFYKSQKGIICAFTGIDIQTNRFEDNECAISARDFKGHHINIKNNLILNAQRGIQIMGDVFANSALPSTFKMPNATGALVPYWYNYVAGNISNNNISMHNTLLSQVGFGVPPGSAWTGSTGILLNSTTNTIINKLNIDNNRIFINAQGSTGILLRNCGDGKKVFGNSIINNNTTTAAPAFNNPTQVVFNGVIEENCNKVILSNNTVNGNSNTLINPNTNDNSSYRFVSSPNGNIFCNSAQSTKRGMTVEGVCDLPPSNLHSNKFNNHQQGILFAALTGSFGNQIGSLTQSANNSFNGTYTAGTGGAFQKIFALGGSPFRQYFNPLSGLAMVNTPESQAIPSLFTYNPINSASSNVTCT
jgi:hypothetical protein